MPVTAPHPDLELRLPRRPVPYTVVLPERGLTKDSGVLLYLHGFGFSYDDPYAKKLLPKLANTLNCLAISLDYHGSRLMAAPSYLIPPQFISGLDRHFGLKIEIPPTAAPATVLPELFSLLARLGVRELPQDTPLLINCYGDYMSFGLLPALDALQVLYDVLGRYPVRRDNIQLLGTSYGGYLALLLAKFAPWTFSVITDNSGFSGPDESLTTIFGGALRKFYGVQTLCINQARFVGAGDGPGQLTPARKVIRELFHPAHWRSGGCGRIFSYHTEQDHVASCASKIRSHAVISATRPHSLRLITEADLDGRLFRTLTHAMNASLYGLACLAQEQAAAAPGPGNQGQTDFDRQTVLDFPCGPQTYRFRYGPPAGVTLEIV